MRILVIGAGTIGLSYGWFLAQRHDVTYLIRDTKVKQFNAGYRLKINDLRRGAGLVDEQWTPHWTVDYHDGYDLILITVDRTQLGEVLSSLASRCSNADVLFMLNHWDLPTQVEQVFAPGEYMIGFPGQVGGGRDESTVEATVFPKGTVLAKATPEWVRELFAGAGLKVRIEPDMTSWLPVHYLQQAVTAGAIAEADGYDSLILDGRRMRMMVKAFRDGLAVCRARGLYVGRIFPVNLFWLPTRVVASALTRMLRSRTTADMVKRHMRHGWKEWVHGYYEVLETGEKLGVSMSNWSVYRDSLIRSGSIS